MIVMTSVAEMKAWSNRARRKGLTIGFVPTMGALHAGHLSLVQRARRENDLAVVSIFVNPLQFGPGEDFKNYPRTTSRDLKQLKKERVAAVFLPTAQAMYPRGTNTLIQVGAMDRVLEGASRPGHFQGVATVVAKLFNVVSPTRAYFGLKDYQQVQVIQRMIDDLHMPVRLVACSTVREADGLALSSRNRYLSKKEREEAIRLYQALFLGRELVIDKVMSHTDRLTKRLRQIFSHIPKCRVDYIAVVDPLTLEPMKKIRRPALLAAAIWIGKTRLIDNVIIS